jgi:putative toxin-antitoxin system antitoxin component (TIGR02293 family)
MLKKEDRAKNKRVIAESSGVPTGGDGGAGSGGDYRGRVPAASSSRPRKVPLSTETLADVTARAIDRAIEVFGTREKALRWLKTPVPSLGDQTPLALLGSPDGIVRVEDALGRIEHGVW